MKAIFLILIYIISIFANDIGIPYVLNTPPSVLSDAAISANGTNLYILTNKKNQLLDWNLFPLILTEINELPKGNFTKLLTSSNENKIIILKQNREFSVSSYSVWDTRLRKIVDNHIIQKNSAGSGVLEYARSVYYVDNRILLTDLSTNMELWDANTFQMLRYGKLRDSDGGCIIKDIPLLTMLTKDKKTFIILNGESIYFVDSSTLEVKKTIALEDNSYKNETLYSIVTSEMLRDYQFDDWMYTSIASIYAINKHKFNHLSQNTSEMFSTKIKDGILEFYNKKTDKKIAKLYYFENNDWLILTSDGYLDGSPETRKYLYIKTLSGESKPIERPFRISCQHPIVE